jgi:hypothetical protein
MKFIYSLVLALTLSSSVVIYHYTTTDVSKKYEDISKLSSELKYISISSQFESIKYKEFVYE